MRRPALAARLRDSLPDTALLRLTVTIAPRGIDITLAIPPIVSLDLRRLADRVRTRLTARHLARGALRRGRR